jgi:hypothetical protein
MERTDYMQKLLDLVPSNPYEGARQRLLSAELERQYFADVPEARHLMDHELHIAECDNPFLVAAYTVILSKPAKIKRNG